MKLTVNGETRQTPDHLTVQALVDELGLSGRPVAVEVNRQVVSHRHHSDTVLREGDTVEVVSLVGGG